MTMILQWIITYAIIRTLLSIGFGVLTYGGVLYALNNAIGYVKTSYNSLPSAVLQFLALAGVPEVMGIICGALVARASIQFFKKIALVS